jgi:hypothetical protein
MESIMAKANQVLDVNVKPVNQFVAMLGGFNAEISKSADMLVSVERLEGDLTDTKAGLSSILFGVLVSQCESVLAGDVYAGEPVSLGWHDAVRLSWLDAYGSAKGGVLNDKALNMAWSRVMKLLSDDFGYEKPKAVTKEAEAKAGKRAEEAQLLAAYEAVPVAELKDKAKALFNKAGDGGKQGKEALKEAKLITKAIDKATSAETELLKVQLKAVRADIVALLKQVDDLYTLQEVRDLLQGSVYDTEALL